MGMKHLFFIVLAFFVLLAGCTNETKKTMSGSETMKSQETGQESLTDTSSYDENDPKLNIIKEIYQKSSSDSLDKLIKNSYPQKELLNAIDFGGTDNTNTHLDRLHEKFPVEALRTFDDGSLIYCVYKLKEGGFLYVFFHNYGDSDDEKALRFANHVFIVKDSLTKNSFDSIKPGKSLADIEKIDTGREFFNELNIWGLLPFGESYHMVKGGFMRVKYNFPDDIGTWEKYDPNNFIVKSIEYVPSGSNLIKAQDELFYGQPPFEYFKYTVLPQDYPQ